MQTNLRNMMLRRRWNLNNGDIDGLTDVPFMHAAILARFATRYPGLSFMANYHGNEQYKLRPVVSRGGISTAARRRRPKTEPAPEPKPKAKRAPCPPPLGTRTV
jgi:hypothetical protein